MTRGVGAVREPPLLTNGHNMAVRTYRQPLRPRDPEGMAAILNSDF